MEKELSSKLKHKLDDITKLQNELERKIKYLLDKGELNQNVFQFMKMAHFDLEFMYKDFLKEANKDVKAWKLARKDLNTKKQNRGN